MLSSLAAEGKLVSTMRGKLRLGLYHEEKRHVVLHALWRFVNALLFPMTTHRFRKWISRKFGARIGNWCALYGTAKIYMPWNLSIGDYVCIAPRVELYNKDKVSIGNSCVLSQDAYLCTASHDISSATMSLVVKPITIQDNVWIGAKATILPGVTIGEGAVVGACAVVAKDVPPWSVVVGNPARVVGKRELHGC